MHVKIIDGSSMSRFLTPVLSGSSNEGQSEDYLSPRAPLAKKFNSETDSNKEKKVCQGADVKSEKLSFDYIEKAVKIS